MDPEIGIPAQHREAVAELLNALLADEYLLYTKSRDYHWSVTGPIFRDLHKLFEEQYEELNEVVDEIAERVRALGAWPFGTVAEFLKHARLKERPGRRLEARGIRSRALGGIHPYAAAAPVPRWHRRVSAEASGSPSARAMGPPHSIARPRLGTASRPRLP